MRFHRYILAGAALLGLAAPALAAPPAAKAAPSGAAAKEQADHALLYLKVFISGLQSENVPGGVKDALVSCIYGNSLEKITISMDKLIAENPDKIHRDKPPELLKAMAAICGFRPEPGAQPPASGGAGNGQQPQGR